MVFLSQITSLLCPQTSNVFSPQNKSQSLQDGPGGLTSAVLTMQQHLIHLGGLFKHRPLEPTPSVSDSVGPEQGPIIYISSKSPGDTDAAQLGATLGDPAPCVIWPHHLSGLLLPIMHIQACVVRSVPSEYIQMPIAFHYLYYHCYSD